MTKQYVMASMAALVLAASTAGAAWPFGGSKEKKSDKKAAAPVVMPPKAGQPVEASAEAPAATNAAGAAMARRVHLRFETDQAELDFLTLAEARRRVQEDARVLKRISQEKQLEIARFQQQLKADFGIDPEANYQFDEDTQAIYLLTPKAGADAEPAADVAMEDRFDKAEHLKLDDEERRTQFLRLVASKQLASEELSVLRLLENEKEMEGKTVHEQMVAKYAITNDREYRYDRARKTLFELVPVPAGTSTTGSAGEAAAR